MLHHKIKRKIVSAIIGLVAWCFVAGPLFSHTLYIQSTRYEVSKDTSKPIFFGWGHCIPFDDGVDGKKIKRLISINPEGEKVDMQLAEGRSLHSQMIAYEMPGTYCFTAETNPGFYTIYIDKKGRERHVTKPKSRIKDAEKIVTSLLSSQFAKAYVVCETPTVAIPEPIGLTLELVPVTPVFDLKKGDLLTLDVIYNGKPFQGKGEWSATYNGYSTLSEDYSHQKKKMAGSRFQVPITHEGIWFIRYSFKIETEGEQKEQCTHLKYGTTLVFDVSPEKEKEEKSH